MLRFILIGAWALTVLLLPASSADAGPSSCTVYRVVDGDTFDCTDGTRVRMLQVDTPEAGACRGAWATAALANIFLRPGTVARLEYDAVTVDRYDRTLAAPIVRGTDCTDYNISIVMAYVGVAKAAYYGDNSKFLSWAQNSETWACNAGWNMWKPGGPFNGAINCGVGSAPEPPASAPSGNNCHASYPDFCITPAPPDLDCPDVGRKRFTVLAPDPHRFDGDRDGVGCES